MSGPSKFSQTVAAAIERRKESAQPAPAPEVLGTIPADSTLTDPSPSPTSATWQSDTGSVDMSEPPPPWELTGGDLEMSDAHKFVRVPENWTLRWMNPRFLDSGGWRYWTA